LRRFLQTLRQVYFGLGRRLLAGLFLGVIIIAGVADSRETQVAATLALLLIVLETLFSIDARLDAREDVRWFATFTQSLPFVAEEIARRLQGGALVRLRWIGVTQEAGWPFCQNMLERLLAGDFPRQARLSIELLLLDPAGIVCKSGHGPDAEVINATLRRVRSYKQDHAVELADRGSTVEVYHYDIRPTWHALLLDSDMLMFSTCRYRNVALAAPQGGAEVVRRSNGGAEAE